MNEGEYISGKKKALEEIRIQTMAKLELLEEIENKFRNTIEKHIQISNEFDGTGNVWINAFALLEDLELSGWDDERVEKICKANQTIGDFNKKNALNANSEKMKDE